MSVQIGPTNPSSNNRVSANMHTTVSASDTISTGLKKVVVATASLEDAPDINAFIVEAVVGNQAGAPMAGSILIRSYKPTSASNPTPIPATVFNKKISWIAVGY